MNTVFMIDVDGTIADLMTPWLKWYNRKWSDNLKTNQLTDWNIHQFAKPECGKKIYDYIEKPNIYNYVKPIPYAIQGIQAIRKFKFEILYCTHSTLGTAGKKYNWLKENGFWEEGDYYIETKDKFLIRADVIIDDAWHNIENFPGYRILYAQPWNSSYNFYNRMNWLQIIQTMNKYEEEFYQ